MKFRGDWKWYTALTAFALFTAFVVVWPVPALTPANAHAAPVATEAHVAPAIMPPARLDPTPAEYDAMLEYVVQEGDTAAGIARLFVVSEDELRRVNQISDGGDFAHGVRIWIPTP